MSLDFLKSRTVWVVVILFVINGIAGVREFIPAGWIPLIDGLLSILAIYFRIDQKTNFKE